MQTLQENYRKVEYSLIHFMRQHYLDSKYYMKSTNIPYELRQKNPEQILANLIH